MHSLNRPFARIFAPAAATQSDETEDIGWIKRANRLIGIIKERLTSLKRMDKPMCKATK